MFEAVIVAPARQKSHAMARDEFEQLVAADIPIKAFRATHKPPDFAWEL